MSADSAVLATLSRSKTVTAATSCGAQKQVATIRRAQEGRRIRDLDHAKEIKAVLDGLSPIKLSGKAAPGSKKLFGSVTTADIVAAVKAAGGPSLDKRVVETGHIKTSGRHSVNVRLHPDVTVSLNLDIITSA
jgi:large subunit ribosomal protein L9